MDTVGDVLKKFYLIPKRCEFRGFEVDNETLQICLDRIERCMVESFCYDEFKNLKVYDGIRKTKILNQEQQKEIKQLRNEGFKIKDLCKKFKVSESTIRRVLKNKY